MELWLEVLDKIQQKISKPAFETWFSETSAEIEDDVITVISDTEFISSWLESRYKTLIFETVREVTNQTYEIEILSIEDTRGSSEPQDTVYGTLKDLMVKQNELINKQQEKIEELEKRIYQLELTNNH